MTRVAFYLCEECHATWKTYWGDDWPMDNMTDFCERCAFNENKHSTSDPHLVELKGGRND